MSTSLLVAAIIVIKPLCILCLFSPNVPRRPTLQHCEKMREAKSSKYCIHTMLVIHLWSRCRVRIASTWNRCPSWCAELVVTIVSPCNDNVVWWFILPRVPSSLWEWKVLDMACGGHGCRKFPPGRVLFFMTRYGSVPSRWAREADHNIVRPENNKRRAAAVHDEIVWQHDESRWSDTAFRRQPSSSV